MSNEDLQETQQKFHKVLNAFLNQKFAINNDVYLEMLISHLSGKYSEGKKEIFTCDLERMINNKKPFILRRSQKVRQ
jgi:hypothetical protein